MEYGNATDYVEDRKKTGCGPSSYRPVRNFAPLNRSDRQEKRRPKNGRIVQSKKNEHLYDTDSSDEHESRSSTSPFELDEHGIRSSVKELGINHSNLRLEEIWGRRETISSPSGTSSTKPQVQNKSPPLSCEKFAKNALMRSLLKQQQESSIDRCSSEICVEPTKVNDVGSMQKQKESDKMSWSQGFVQDSIQPDIFYRPTTVTNQNVDFTIESVGVKTVVGPRRFIIENYNKKDFVFPKKKHQYKS